MRGRNKLVTTLVSGVMVAGMALAADYEQLTVKELSIGDPVVKITATGAEINRLHAGNVATNTGALIMSGTMTLQTNAVAISYDGSTTNTIVSNGSLTNINAANLTAASVMSAVNIAAATNLAATGIAAGGTFRAINGSALTSLSPLNITGGCTFTQIVATAGPTNVYSGGVLISHTP
jgi:hypothetical protein